MAGQSGKQAAALMEQLGESPHAVGFFQALRKLQCAHPESPAIGASRRPGDDPIRFGQRPSLAFPPSSLDMLDPGDETRQARLFVNFLGLLGPNGPMPLQFTEYARERQLHHADSTLADFLDIFHHRMISFFFRAWAVNQPCLHYESANGRFSDYIGSLIGIGMPSLCDRDAVPDSAKRYYAGRLASLPRNAEGLQSILADFFGCDVTVNQFVGRWVNIPQQYQCRLGESAATGTLGESVLCGSRMWDCQNTFRLRLGPLSFSDYERFLPGGGRHAELRDWVRNYVGDALSWDAQLILAAADVPAIRLGQVGRLGWTSYLRSQPFGCDSDDMVLAMG